jgi:hypothetical protein
MAGVTANLDLSLDVSFAGAGDLGTPKQRVVIEEALSLAPGTDTIGKANIFFADTRQLAASGSEDLDLAGVLVDAFGATIAAGEVVLVFVKAKATNTNSVIIGAATAAWPGPLGATGTYTLKPGEWFLAVSRTGWAVGAGSTDDLKIANSAGGTVVDYDIAIIARTVAA